MYTFYWCLYQILVRNMMIIYFFLSISHGKSSIENIQVFWFDFPHLMTLIDLFGRALELRSKLSTKLFNEQRKYWKEVWILSLKFNGNKKLKKNTYTFCVPYLFAGYIIVMLAKFPLNSQNSIKCALAISNNMIIVTSHFISTFLTIFHDSIY